MRAASLPFFALLIFASRCLLEEPMASVTMTSRIDGETTNQVLVDAFNMGFKTATRMAGKLFDSMMDKLKAVEAFDAKVEVEGKPADSKERDSALQSILERNKEPPADQPEEQKPLESQQQNQNRNENIDNIEEYTNCEEHDNTEDNQVNDNDKYDETPESNQDNENTDNDDFFPRANRDLQNDAVNPESMTSTLQQRPLTPFESSMLIKEMVADALAYPQAPIEELPQGIPQFPGVFRPIYPRAEVDAEPESEFEEEVAPQKAEVRSEALRKLFGPRPDLRKIFLNINGELTPLSELRVVRGGREIPVMVSLTVNEDTNALNISLLN